MNAVWLKILLVLLGSTASRQSIEINIQAKAFKSGIELFPIENGAILSRGVRAEFQVKIVAPPRTIVTIRKTCSAKKSFGRKRNNLPRVSYFSRKRMSATGKLNFWRMLSPAPEGKCSLDISAGNKEQSFTVFRR
ncbi:hypothetical protein KKC32_02715 [Patescibacteria group bacterium]|nr:hypothetical protein [Patescibacteria group bacterium]